MAVPEAEMRAAAVMTPETTIFVVTVANLQPEREWRIHGVFGRAHAEGAHTQAPGVLSAHQLIVRGIDDANLSEEHGLREAVADVFPFERSVVHKHAVVIGLIAGGI